ncbi:MULTISPECIES: DUF397 domain-containing protein [Streptomyces]|uniref:DUF397 domain-containing protein n=1 Tax=Streptomyces sudanensis TaxID=436397 RepID=A0ABY4TEW2_9ACTN|nr:MULTISPECIES: DUF397 domain-containing protein [Streptomyces]MCP9956915.1 DUF397 domain-containing protein [Streptomyces sudanensis]MCP9986101.1 DUF397 domain-containing protein [Streptomyces sudanensis]MCQ0002501.1 DUF397 domain-containing protein [Streptomyces sudanensis]URN17272.1 DUF397 domain-containing protein [Streptomyces sudanensis]
MRAESELAWYKSSHSTGDGGQCVEIAVRPHAIHIRDSKDINRPALSITAPAWAAFVGFAAR